VEIVHLYISPVHIYVGHHNKPPGEEPVVEVESIECVAGHGIRDDRYFDYRDSYKGQITFFAQEVYEALCDALPVHDKSPAAARRNVMTKGVDLNLLIGSEFEVQGVHFQGMEECRPCYWMDQAFATGAEKFLQGKGGLRARILSDGILRVTNVVANH
jgi:MOSC domain-containing protein YiiM